jgi:hypothetical protein
MSRLLPEKEPMKLCIAWTLVVMSFSASAIAEVRHTRSMATGNPTVVEHGGGCRKSSPPGQCCHADNSRGGAVHCH